MALATGLFASLVLAALATGRRLDAGFVSVGLAGRVRLARRHRANEFAGVRARSWHGERGRRRPHGVRQVGRRPRGIVGLGRATELLGSLTGTLGVGVLGYALGTRETSTITPQTAASAERSSETNAAGDAGDASTGTDSGENSENAGDGTNVRTVEQYFADAEDRSLDIEGLEGLVSGDDFYEVDTQNVNPKVTLEEWSLLITGAVESEAEFGYDEITAMDRELRFGTLRCVSDTLNGTKMDNDLWTGVPIERLLEGTNRQGKFVMLRSTDGYYEEFRLDTLLGSFLAYGKNGGPLPRQHGYPVRALVPGHWEEISVKWLDEIEVLEGPQKGFWEKRGWHGTGPVNTVAKLHAVDRLDSGKIQIAGHTYARTRGIERVEVSTDGRETWQPATLSERLPPGTAAPQSVDAAENAWRQWAYTYEPSDGEHEVIGRAVDGTGTLQPRDGEDSPYLDGAAGWVSKTIDENNGLFE